MLYLFEWIFRVIWFAWICIATYIVIPIFYVIFWILFPLVFRFKVRKLDLIMHDVKHGDWQEVDTDPFTMGFDEKHAYYPNPIDFLLKRNVTMKY